MWPVGTSLSTFGVLAFGDLVSPSTPAMFPDAVGIRRALTTAQASVTNAGEGGGAVVVATSAISISSDVAHTYSKHSKKCMRKF